MPQITHALLLAAGLGTRLRPLTTVRAKPAIPVAGTAMARRIITWLSSSGVTDTVLNLHYLPETIAAVVGDGSDLGVTVRYSWEQPVVLGSAGGPRQALDIIGSDTFLIVNGDTFTDAALPPLLEAHLASDALVTMAVIPNPEPDHYSGLRLADDGAVLGVEPRGSPRPSFHFIGVQVARRQAFAGIPKGHAANSVSEVYLSWIANRPGSIRAHICDARFWDIGTVTDYWVTSRAFAAGEPFAAAPAADAGAHVVDSIVWDGVMFGEGCCVNGCIVTDGVHVRPGASYENMVLVRGAAGETIATPFAPERS
jgi:mannose-1-phosphate guanylyltransferase